MHNFPQFTHGTLWSEFVWVGAINFEGKFMVRGQFSGGQFSSGAIILGSEAIVKGAIVQGQFSSRAIILGGNCPGSVIQGAIIRRAIFFEDNCPRTACEICEQFVFKHSETVEYVKNLPTF